MRLRTLIPCLMLSAFAALAQDDLATILLSARAFPCVAVDAQGSRNWPGTIKFSGTPEAVTGEVTWTTLNSVHRIAGRLSGTTLRFTEVSAIKAGSAHLNTSYTLTFAHGGLSGKYVDGADVGRFSIDLSRGAPAPPTVSSAQDDLATTLLSGRIFLCQAVAAQGSGSWPGSIKFSGTPGAVTGELTWTTLNSVHRIAGSLSGTTLRFTEVSAINAGSAHLNVSYALTLAKQRYFIGEYVDGADVGRFWVDLSRSRDPNEPEPKPRRTIPE